jgi:pimeloyl-ACP methyl ester carboxylesterase
MPPDADRVLLMDRRRKRLAVEPVTTSRPTASEVPIRNVSLHVLEVGPADGAPLLLLHGFPETSRAWRSLMPRLAQTGFRTIAPDMPGYGDSGLVAGIKPYRLDLLVDAVLGLADALGLERFVLAGHDWGGVVAWALAALHPERIDRLIILNAPHPDAMAVALRRDPRQMLRSFYIGFFRLPWVPELILRAADFRMLRRSLVASSKPGTFTRADLDGYAAQWAKPGRLTAMLNYYRALRYARTPIGRIRTPTLILWGREDRFLTLGLAAASTDMCDDGRVVTLDATHWLVHEHPERIAGEITAFAGRQPKDDHGSS